MLKHLNPQTNWKEKKSARMHLKIYKNVIINFHLSRSVFRQIVWACCLFCNSYLILLIDSKQLKTRSHSNFWIATWDSININSIWWLKNNVKRENGFDVHGRNRLDVFLCALVETDRWEQTKQQLRILFVFCY